MHSMTITSLTAAAPSRCDQAMSWYQGSSTVLLPWQIQTIVVPIK
jgi:hypothetical protein